VWGLVRGNDHGWTSAGIVVPIVAGVLLVAAFVAWELRASSPMLPMQFFRDRTFTLTNVASLFMFFGMFGSIFFLAQYFQTVQGYSPLQSGLRILPWTAMPALVHPWSFPRTSPHTIPRSPVLASPSPGRSRARSAPCDSSRRE
jgi:hypothetical protein